MYSKSFSNKIAEISIKKFNDLPKTGKPTTEEWTILSCIAKFDKNLEIVALGTGTKCIGETKMSPNGDILNDSHAEIICRRAFLRYIYDEITLALTNNESIFELKQSKFQLRDNISFHFFTSHVPCGDAAIFPKQNPDDFGDILQNNNVKCLEGSKKRLLEDDLENEDRKKLKVDTFRTGAKCLKDDVNQDAKTGLDYHILGAIRTKPGRGDPTLSVSCSDKIAKWTFVGIQGSLLTYLLSSPIYLTSVTIAANTPFSQESFLRAIKNRFNLKSFQQKIPFIGQADVSFLFNKTNTRRPCPSSIIWSKVTLRALEIAVDGKKQGVTKKNRNKKEGRLSICKKELFATFCCIINNYTNLKLKELSGLSYREVKNKSDYCKVWNLIKSEVFRIWTAKNEKLLEFLNT